MDFYIVKARYYDRLRDRLNDRQAKVIARMFREGIDGFEGGLSAEIYISITRVSRATATRDLQDLVEKGALLRSGTLRHTRYGLNIPKRWIVTGGGQCGRLLSRLRRRRAVKLVGFSRLDTARTRAWISRRARR